MIFLAQAETILKIADHAASAENGDRWMAVAFQAIVVVGGAVAFKWLVAFMTKLGVDHAAALVAKDADAAKERKELHDTIVSERVECRQTRMEDQKSFLNGITNLTEKVHALSGHMQADTALLKVHHETMMVAHSNDMNVLVGLELERRDRIKLQATQATQDSHAA